MPQRRHGGAGQHTSVTGRTEAPLDFASLTILCVGDVMLDRFVHGDIERISPEAPVPVLRLRERREMPGGVGNVAANVASLGGRACLVGVAGRDEAGAALRASLRGIDALLVDASDRPTTCKTRFVAGRQQVVRADDESSAPLEGEHAARFLQTVQGAMARAQAVILSDYGKGVVTPEISRGVIGAARAHGIPVFVDPKSADYGRYRGATCITPNLRELAAASGMPVGTEAEIVAAAQSLRVRAEADAILVTRSERGMTLVPAEGEPHSVSARAREVFDVSGAGDTVIATLALAHASGRTLVQAMHIANAAAGVAVSKLGTATVTIAEVLHELAAEEGGAGAAPGGLTAPEDAARLLRHWREQGFAVGFTNGCFDILHPGHVSLLAEARRQCDRLIVALNTDASVQRLKGPTRPVNPLAARAQVMAALRHVDCVTSFGEDTPLALIEALVPDVLIKGADYREDQVVGADVVRAAGGRVVLVSLVPGASTTGLIGRIGSAPPARVATAP